MLLDPTRCTLIVIDVQSKLFNKIYKNQIIKENILNCIKISSILKIPVVYSEQYPRGLGKTVDVIAKALHLCSAKMIEKTTFSCFPIGSKLTSPNDYLKTKQIIITGIETHICVLQTAVDIKNQGFDVYVIDEAVGSRKISNKKLAIERLSKIGVQVISLEMMLFELLRDSNNKHFKELSKIIK